MKPPPLDLNRTILLAFLILAILIAAVSRASLKIGPSGLEFRPMMSDVSSRPDKV